MISPSGFPYRERTVYFVQQRGLPYGPVKIGSSINAIRRVDDLDHWSPYELSLIASFPGNCGLERYVQYKFRKAHMRREWFAWNKEIQDFIDDVNSGDFDPMAIPPCPRGFRLWDNTEQEPNP